MAPLIRTTIQLLLSSIRLESPSHDAGRQIPPYQPQQSLVPGQPTANGPSFSAISWGYNRMDVFGKDKTNGALTHKFWDGYQWQPSVDGLENLGETPNSGPPGAVAGNGSKMDIFTVSVHGALQHKYFDGNAWKPSHTDMGDLSDNDILDETFAPSATSWEPGRLDIFGRGEDFGLWHKYFDGSSWGPSEMGLENLGGDLLSAPAAVSWGPNRNDIFALQEGGQLGHVYWDGSSWSTWETIKTQYLFYATPTVVSWAENRLDVFAVDNGNLVHIYWTGSQWDEENLGGTQLVGTVAAVSWAVNRIDIVALGEDKEYHYKYFDGSNWSDWFAKGGSFSSAPSLVSWSDNRLDIWGITDEDQLAHQTWYGNGWYPGPDEWEFLGDDIQAFH